MFWSACAPDIIQSVWRQATRNVTTLVSPGRHRFGYHCGQGVQHSTRKVAEMILSEGDAAVFSFLTALPKPLNNELALFGALRLMVSSGKTDSLNCWRRRIQFWAK